MLVGLHMQAAEVPERCTACSSMALAACPFTCLFGSAAAFCCAHAMLHLDSCSPHMLLLLCACAQALLRLTAAPQTACPGRRCSLLLQMPAVVCHPLPSCSAPHTCYLARKRMSSFTPSLARCPTDKVGLHARWLSWIPTPSPCDCWMTSEPSCACTSCLPCP